LLTLRYLSIEYLLQINIYIFYSVVVNINRERMSRSKSIVGAANKGSRVFRETFQHSSNDVTHYFPGHMARGRKLANISS